MPLGTNTLLTLLCHNTTKKRKNEESIMKIIFIILLFFVTTLTANEAPQMSIDAEIAKIKSAPSGERVRLMNEFKIRVSQMNTQERLATIKKMQTKMHAKNSTIPAKEHMSQMQVRNSRDMKNFQNMNHKQVSSSFKQDAAIMQGNRPTLINATVMEKIRK